MTRDQYMALSKDEKATIAAQLSCFPRLSREDRCAFLSISDRMYTNLIKHAKTLGLTTGIDLYGSNQQAFDPTAEEFLWRFQHQTADHILSCFGGRTLALIRKAGVADQMPDALAIKICNVEEVQRGDPDTLPPEVLRSVHPIPGKGYLVRILATDVTIDCQDEAEQATVNRLVEDFNARFDITKAGWEKVKPVIDYDLSIRRWWETRTAEQRDDPKTLAEHGALLKALRDARKELDFPLKSNADDADRLQGWIESAPEYLAKRGWRHTVVCGECNSTFQVYYPVCRKVVNFLAHWTRALNELKVGQTTVAECIDIGREILNEPIRDPFFDPQLLALGTAFVLPLVEWFDALRDPKVGQVRFVDDPGEVTSSRYPEGLPDHPAPWCLLLQSVPDNPNADSVCRGLWINSGETDEVPWPIVLQQTRINVTEEDLEDGLAAFFETGPDHWNKRIPFSIRNRAGRDEFGRPQVIEVDE